MNIINMLKKYWRVFIIVLIAILLVCVIGLYRCNSGYRKKIRQLETQVSGLRNNVELLETIITTDERITNETNRQIKKINRIPDTHINNELNKLWVQNTN